MFLERDNIIFYKALKHNTIEVIQKKIIRIMTYSSYLAHTGPIFIDLTLLPFNQIFIDRMGITMFKVEY